MLGENEHGENEQSENNLRGSIANINYMRVDEKRSFSLCPCNPCHAIYLCNSQSLIPSLGCCLIATFYLSSCALSFYIGHTYDQGDCNSASSSAS